jgi:hypothetical protein
MPSYYFTNDLNVVKPSSKIKVYIRSGINAKSGSRCERLSVVYYGGESLQLNNLDLAPYFELQNLQNHYNNNTVGFYKGSYNFVIGSV